MTDLVNLFVPPAATPAFAQGVLVTFDPLTGSNSVNVQGQVFSNLPLLNVPDVVNMTAGSVVMLAQLGGSYAIMGRVVTPSAAALNASAVAFDQASASATGFGITTSATAKASASVTVPAWANRLTVVAVGNGSVVNSTANPDRLQTYVAYSGGVSGNGGATEMDAPAGSYGTGTSTAFLHSQSVSPGATVTFSIMLSSTVATWASGIGNIANIDALCVYQRT